MASCALEDLLELRDLAVADLSGLLQVRFALGAVEPALGVGDVRLGGVDRFDRGLLVLPARGELSRALRQVGELLLEGSQPCLRCVVLLLLEGLLLDLELGLAALDLVDLGGDRVDLDLEARGGLVDQVDRLVGEESVGDVALGKRRCCDDSGVLNADAVVLFVALLEPAEDRDRVVDVGLADHDRLEAPLECGVGLDVLAVLVERRRADGAELAACEHRLQEVGGVDGALGSAGSDDRVELVDEEDDAAGGLLDLVQDGLQALLELAAVLGAGEEGADVERDHAAVAKRVRDVAVDDSLGEALDDRGLAHAGLADQDGVVLGPAREHLDHTADLLVAADDGVELLRLGFGGEVAPELVERARHLLGVGGGDPGGTLDFGQRVRDGLGLRQVLGDRRLVGGEGEEEVADGDVLVAALRHLLLGALQRADEGLRRPEFRQRRRRRARRARQCVADIGSGRGRVHVQPLEGGGRKAVLLLEEGEQKVRGSDLGVPRGTGDALSGGDRLLSVVCESVWSHAG